jgi:hypothetical protein
MPARLRVVADLAEPAQLVAPLSVGAVVIDWGTPPRRTNHARLFRKEDLSNVAYQHARRPAYSSKLASVARRLDLLGYTLDTCRQLFDSALQADPGLPRAQEFSFDAFRQSLRGLDLAKPAGTQQPGSHLGKLAAVAMLNSPAQAASNALLACYGDRFFEALDPYVLLRLLGESPSNLEHDVVWRFNDLVEAGQLDLAAQTDGVAEAQRCVVMTRRASSAAILRAALPLVLPDVADFFDIPEAGEISEVVEFCRAVAALPLRSKLLVVLDNDSEGLDALQRLRMLSLPRSLRVLRLPGLEEMRQATTLGPAGKAVEDVNGRAVSMECFLDLGFGSKEPATFRWMSYHAGVGQYQGELVERDARAAAFLQGAHAERGYDLRKLRALWGFLLKEASGNAE